MFETVSDLSRRNFLKGVALGTAGLAGAGLIAGCSPQDGMPSVGVAPDGSAKTASAESGIPSFFDAPEPIGDDKIAETLDADVLVIGAGIAGATTASSCVENGLKVVLVEKLENPRAIGLDYGLVNPSILAEKGVEPEDVYGLARDHMEKSCHMCRGDKVYRFMSRSGEAGDWYIEKAKGYGFEPQVMAYASNSDHYRNNRGVIELWHKGIDLGEEENCYAPMEEMLANLSQEVVSAGGEYRNNTEAVQLLQSENGEVVGAICKSGDTYIKINASRGVVLAAGDYAMDAEMLSYYTEWDFDSYDPEFCSNYSTGTGDGHKMGLWAGAKMQEAPHPLMIFMGYAYGYLRVNKNGERYVNEDSGYVGGVNSQLQQPGAASWAIWDNKWSKEIPASLAYGGGMSWDQDFRRIEDPWTAEGEETGAWSWECESGLLLEADSLDGLADAIGFEGEAKETFLATVERYNALVDEGDSEFGKRPELMTKIAEPPFYALKMVVEVAVSTAGLITNADSECLDEGGKPIPGLYAVGNNAGGLFGIDYNEVTVPGISIGRAVTFGYLLGQHLAK